MNGTAFQEVPVYSRCREHFSELSQIQTSCAKRVHGRAAATDSGCVVTQPRRSGCYDVQVPSLVGTVFGLARRSIESAQTRSTCRVSLPSIQRQAGFWCDDALQQSGRQYASACSYISSPSKVLHVIRSVRIVGPAIAAEPGLPSTAHLLVRSARRVPPATTLDRFETNTIDSLGTQPGRRIQHVADSLGRSLLKQPCTRSIATTASH
jgi:hypothetical protein